MNHYERLKVSPEAPPEVIRAAYRALAAKLHPDRKVGDSGPGDPMHDDMAALNASYLVLMDSKLRMEYDQTLAATAAAAAQAAAPQPPSRWGRARKRAAATEGGTDTQFADPPETRIDVDWQSSSVPPLPEPWFKEPKWMLALTASFAIALGGVIWGGLQQAERMQFDRSLSAAHPGAALPPGALPGTAYGSSYGADGPDAAAAASAPALSPEKMAHMSDSELLAAMPDLLTGKKAPAGQPSTASALPGEAADMAPEPARALAVPSGPHMLDGAPLGLKLAPLQLGGRSP